MALSVCKHCDAEFTAETVDKADRRLNRHIKIKHENHQANVMY